MRWGLQDLLRHLRLADFAEFVFLLDSSPDTSPALVQKNMTEETQPSTETQAVSQHTDQNSVSTTTEVVKTREGKREKCRPMTKVVIRRLPPTMTQEQFLEQVSPLSDYDYLHFAKADMSLGQYAFSRAYIDFVDPQDVFGFREKFDNYVFVDSKGTEFPAVVEYAPFQRVPKKRVGKKKDIKCGTIESDPYYINFLESMKNQEIEAGNAQPKTEYSFQLVDHAAKKVTSTPLLDFLKQRKQEKQRIRDEKREEKRRRDLERKRSKDEPMVSKVLKNVEDKDMENNRDVNKENKDDKERVIIKDLKNKNKKEDRYRDKMGREVKLPAKQHYRDDRAKDGELKLNKKHEDKKYGKRDDRGSHGKQDQTHEKDEISYKEKKMEEKRGKSYEKMRQEKKRLVETQKKQNDEPKDNLNDNVDQEDEESCRSIEKNQDNKNKQKNRKSSSDVTEKSSEMSHVTADDQDSTKDELEEVCERLSRANVEEEEEDKKPSKSSPTKSVVKRRSSLESGGDGGSGSKSSGSSGSNSGSDSLRRHKSLDGGDDSNLQKNECDEKDKDKKDPRVERRIRNKDRPAMEIYRPGMGKFSKKRIGQEKGSEERVTPSQSPTPTSGNSSVCKSGKNSGSEVRTMTFKRSVSREVS